MRITNACRAAGDYFDACLLQRNPGPQAAGSTFLTKMTQADILNAKWEPYSHPEVKAPAIAFKAPIPGRVGVVSLDILRKREMLVGERLTLALLDPKGVGTVEATVVAKAGIAVAFTTLILGPTRDGSGEALWTFFPGDPIAPSTLPAEGRHGQRLTVAQAQALGLHHAKVVASL